jgi:hypothetical protein
MERKTVTVNDFLEIGRKNDYFIWHFLQKKQMKNTLSLWSYFDEKKIETNPIKILLDEIPVPYYESYTEDSIDFLSGIGIASSKLWKPATLINQYVPMEYFYSPVIIGFKKYNNVYSTMETCYCIEGFTEIIGRLDPKLFENLY